jgi:hypothetical protein
MEILQLWSLWALFMLLDARYSSYHTDDWQGPISVFDCLYAYIIDYVPDDDTPHTNNYHLTPYCRRLSRNENREELLMRSNEHVSTALTFSHLCHQGETSTQLLIWLAPIDIAERYETDAGNSTEVFHNCSSPRFGSMCQYKFDNGTLASFGDTAHVIFANRLTLTEEEFLTIGTCYPFLTSCDRGLSSLCLDGREVCDGSFDCLHGEDGQWRQLLEVTECADNELRCHYGGQCIPLAFLPDGIANLDCRDGTDESAITSSYGTMPYRCFGVATFRCEEYTRRHPLLFSCGDGESRSRLIPHWNERCYNARDKKMSVSMLTSFDHISNTSCQQAFYCSLRIDQIHFEKPIENSNHCEPLADRCSSTWLALPEHPIIFVFFSIHLLN